jgi:hypothetical protein
MPVGGEWQPQVVHGKRTGGHGELQQEWGGAVYRTNGIKPVLFTQILAKTRNNLILLIYT